MVKESILKYREVLALEYSMGHISFEEMRNALGSDAEDVKMVHEITRNRHQT